MGPLGPGGLGRQNSSIWGPADSGGPAGLLSRLPGGFFRSFQIDNNCEANMVSKMSLCCRSDGPRWGHVGPKMAFKIVQIELPSLFLGGSIFLSKFIDLGVENRPLKT